MACNPVAKASILVASVDESHILVGSRSLPALRARSSLTARAAECRAVGSEPARQVDAAHCGQHPGRGRAGQPHQGPAVGEIDHAHQLTRHPPGQARIGSVGRSGCAINALPSLGFAKPASSANPATASNVILMPWPKYRHIRPIL